MLPIHMFLKDPVLQYRMRITVTLLLFAVLLIVQSGKGIHDFFLLVILLHNSSVIIIFVIHLIRFLLCSYEAVDIDNVKIKFYSFGHSMKRGGFISPYVISAFCRIMFHNNHPSKSKKNYFFPSIGVSYFSTAWSAFFNISLAYFYALLC